MDLIKKLNETIKTSEAIKDFGDSMSSFPRIEEYRSLSSGEIEYLKKNGNRASRENWSNILVSSDFIPDNIENCRFRRNIFIGKLSEKHNIDGLSIRAGLYNSTISNSYIADNCLVRDVSALVNVNMNSGVRISNCGHISHDAGASLGNGTEIPIVIETGGREILLFADMTIEIAAELIKRRSDRQKLDEYTNIIKDYCSYFHSEFGIIGKDAEIKNTTRINNFFIGQKALIDGVSRIENSTILSNPEEQTKIGDLAIIQNSVIQWGCSVLTGAHVEKSAMLEHSVAERQGKIMSSVIGPNSCVGEGEVTSSLMGPFTGFHHQSMLISTFWPAGRGNVSSGANIGSNHTTRNPDQELFAGEGMFFGLGTNIKFPSDFTDAPYTIIAAGAHTLPQKVIFPFSLISPHDREMPGVSPAIDEIRPGWVLSDNHYMLKRNNIKFKERDKAHRHDYQTEIFRPENVEKMRKALYMLRETSGKDIYTEHDIPGMGKNYMFEKSRLKGIENYETYIKYSACRGIYRILRNIPENESLPMSPEKLSANPANVTEYWKEILDEFSKEAGIKDILKELVKINKITMENIFSSRKKDEMRGVRIIPDYIPAHGKTEDSYFIKNIRAKIEEENKFIEELCSRI
ncbi:MAG: DUF4954 family protein [Fibrobacterota bacterium]